MAQNKDFAQNQIQSNFNPNNYHNHQGLIDFSINQLTLQEHGQSEKQEKAKKLQELQSALEDFRFYKQNSDIQTTMEDYRLRVKKDFNVFINNNNSQIHIIKRKRN